MKTLYNYIMERMTNNEMPEHRIDEMAQVSDPSDQLQDGVKIWVYGEKDEQDTKTPHFHVVGDDFEFEVHIEHIYELNIWRTKKIDKKSNANTWNERANIRKSIKKWLNQPNRDAPKMSNAEVIVLFWNGSNSTHKIPQSFKD